MTLVDCIGSFGVFLILSAYFLSVNGRLETKDLSYILLNLFGGALACLASILMEYIPFVILEGVWALVSLMALMNFFRTKNKT